MGIASNRAVFIDADTQSSMKMAVARANMDADSEAYLSPKTYNWDGTEQGVEVTPIDTEAELGESQMGDDAKKLLDHKVFFYTA